VDRQGRVEVLAGSDKLPVDAVRFSPTDGRRLAVIQQAGGLWLFDLERATYMKLSPEGVAAFPCWSPDGQRLAFMWSAAGPLNVWLASMDGSCPLERLIESKSNPWCSSWSRDGRFLALVEEKTETNSTDIAVYSVQDRKLIPFLNSRWDEGYPEFSPDGRWMAYSSNETGQYEVYLRSFPDGSRKLAVSNQGGGNPAWSHDGRELLAELQDRRCGPKDSHFPGLLQSYSCNSC
jgi:Tol biopolymer transport system component